MAILAGQYWPLTVYVNDCVCFILNMQTMHVMNKYLVINPVATKSSVVKNINLL